jgi:uncharacterized PurR-regulated membrane protein YhhQ (DUF165 family)
MRNILYALVYLGALFAANYSVYVFGPVSTPINAFLMIGLDLVLRDKLHDAYGFLGASALAVVAAAVTYAINPAAAGIAIASAVAFVCASLADGSIYQALRGKSFLTRSNASNVAGALTDSIAFPTIAFGAIMPEIVAAQLVAKVIGGFLWSLLLRKEASA